MNSYNGKIQILNLLDGARQAVGLTVIIDVFRAFTLECYLYGMGVKEIRPVGTIQEAFDFKKRWPDCLLVGERKGKICEGFDFGNSPASVIPEKVTGKTIIHTTSSGTQGIVHATGAEEIITGSLANARAIAEYIIAKQPEIVSLVCMGNGGVRPAKEDELCAEYIKSLLKGNEMPDIKQRVLQLQYNGGEHFFDKNQQDVFPEHDFWMCIQYNCFPFIIRVQKDAYGFIAKKVEVH